MNTDTTMLAGAALTRLLAQSYRTDEGVHAETVVGAAAALAGEFALRAVEPRLPAGGFVASQEASALLFGTDPLGTTGLCGVIRQGAVRSGADESEIPELEEIAARLDAAQGETPYPPLSVPEDRRPREWSPNACPRLRLAVDHMCREHDLTGVQAATALVIAVAFLIHETRDVLPPAIAARLALETMVGVSRMAPIHEERTDPATMTAPPP